MPAPFFGSLAPYPETLASARSWFDEAPGWTYGSVLPLARGPEGQLRPALPQALRGAAQGYIDAVAGTQTGDLTPQATETLMFGSLVPGGAGVRGGLGAVTSPIRAFHGSPHDFDRFDLSKIGTGEGAQAYGHGLYFADNEDVARSYRDALSRKKLRVGDREGAPSIIADQIWETTGRPLEGLDNWNVYDGIKAAVDDFMRGLDVRVGAHKDEFGPYSEGYDVGARALERATFLPAQGRMYEVGIRAEPGDLLDWDAPLADQPLHVQGVLERMGVPTGENLSATTFDDPIEEFFRGGPIPSGGSMKGADIYRSLGSDVDAANRLREAGIPGIRYLDAGSRGEGDGTRNYVVFDDALIDIVRKYGLSGLGFGSLVPATLQQPNTAAKGDRLRFLSPYES